LRDVLELEEKLLLARRFGNFLALANLKVEQIVPFGGGEVELELAPSVGLSYAVTPSVVIGAEWWMEAELEEGAESVHYAGPTLMWQTDELFVSLGGYFKLAGDDE